jgi:probable F420-dependent oxidoreductase
MKAGVVYPQIELGGDTGAVKAFAQAAEDLGYDHIVIYDHILGADHAGREPKLTGPYKQTDPFHEPLVTYAYLAGVTKKLELVTGVIILPQRQTALFAKQAADVDLFSNGRLRLGVGIGWNWVEFDGLEMSGHFRRRGNRQEQQIALIRKLWEEPVVEYSDSDHRIDRAGILPRPKRQIPIWLGGSSEAAFDRAARIGDGFLFSGRTRPRRCRSRRGSRPGCVSSEEPSASSALSPFSNTAAATINGPATSRRGVRPAGATSPS